MQFTHIHTSSRYSRSAASLETAIDVWRQQASIITVTEVDGTDRRRTLSQVGWGLNQYSGSDGRAEHAQMWDLSVWTQLKNEQVLVSGRWPTTSGGELWSIRVNLVWLKNRASGHVLLSSVVHMPTGATSQTGFNPTGYKGAERVHQYKTAATQWGKVIQARIRSTKPDIVLVSADWNLNIAKQWAQDFILGCFKAGMKVSYKDFHQKPTLGRSFFDFTLYTGVSTTGSRTIPDVSDSSDHEPFKTVYSTLHKPGTPILVGSIGTNDSGNTGYGTAWWSFSDYDDPTIYNIPQE